AISRTRACGGEFKYVISRLSRQSKSRRLKFNVFRHIHHDGESWGVEITNRKGQILRAEWIAEKTNWYRSGYAYWHSILKGDNYVVLDFLKRQSFKLNMAKIEAKLLGR